jgi:hypothetical protein
MVCPAQAVVDSQQWMALHLGVVKLATKKNVIVKGKIFPHQNIQKHTWNSPGGKTLKQMTANKQHMYLIWRD